jgi:serine protease Do
MTHSVPLKGSDIFVIGNPEGLESTVSKGIVSAIREEANKVIQISAPISPGSSGSPIMDMEGSVFAIATYQHTEGQNLNFGYWIGCQEKLVSNTDYQLSNEETGNLFVMNKMCKTESNLILNSIEVNEKNTVLNFTFTNTALAWGDKAFIFTTIGDRDKSFYIEDVESNKRYYLYDATIGGSAKDPTFVKLGESRRFKLMFPPIGSASTISVKEGMEGSDWSFSGIDLHAYKSKSFNDGNFFNDFYFQTGLAALSEKEFASAYRILTDFASRNKDNDYAQNLAGIISYVLGNNLDALLHFRKAIEIRPTDDKYYFNLYFLNEIDGNTDEALKCIASAIQLNPSQPEYYYYRARLYIKKKHWKEALTDLDKYIESDRIIPSIAYRDRGIAKVALKDKSACNDFRKAHSLATTEAEKKTILDWGNKYCR